MRRRPGAIVSAVFLFIHQPSCGAPGQQSGQPQLSGVPAHLESVIEQGSKLYVNKIDGTRLIRLIRDIAETDATYLRECANAPDSSPFIGLTLISEGQFQRFLAATDTMTERRIASNLKGDGSEPATSVTWSEAMAYCRWAGGRLPTECEWLAATAGDSIKSSGEGRRPQHQRNLLEPPSEWLADPAAPRVLNTEEEREEFATKTTDRVIRGGHFDDLDGKYTREFRPTREGRYRGKDLGFRLVIPSDRPQD